MMPLTVVRGMMGTGKTTLVADWARLRQEQGDAIVWFQNPGSAGPEGIEAVLAARLEVPGDGPLVVVIDNAHLLTDGARIRQLCEQLVRHPRLHLVLCARWPHPIRKRALERGIASIELTGRDLQARAGELAALAQLWGHELSGEEESALLAETGGWLAPARWALDHSDPEHDPMGLLAAGRYVQEHVVASITCPIPELVALTLSLAEELTLEIVRAVCVEYPHTPGMLGPHTPESVLADYERHGFVERVPHPGPTPIWRAPVLVRRVLAASFSTDWPRLAAHTHKIIARHLAHTDAQRDTGRIIRHASAARDWGVLARMWTAHGLRMVTAHEHETLVAYGEIPTPIMRRHPVLALAASVVTSLGRPDDPHRRARAARHYASVGRAALPAHKQSIRAAETGWTTAQIMADRLNGDPERAVRRAEEHAQQVIAGDATAGSAATWGWFEMQWGLSAFAAGQGPAALQLLGQAGWTARGAAADFLVAAASGQRALIHAIGGQTQEAVKDLATHRSVSTPSSWLESAVAPAGLVAEGILCLDRLDAHAIEHLERTVAGSHLTEEWALLALVRALHALLFGDPMKMLAHMRDVEEQHRGLISPGGRDRLAVDRTNVELLLALGELNRAERYLDGAHDPQGLTLAVPRARLALITGDHARARSIALDFSWRRGMIIRDRADLFMIEAAAALALDCNTSASEAFTRAHSLAASIVTLIPYATVPREVLMRLLAVSGVVLPDAALSSIRACREVYPSHGEIIRLTVREAVVLRAMAEHETLADVAAQFTVSVNTIKKQSAAVYAKLGVNDRASALIRAHRLGLLSEADDGITGSSSQTLAT